MGAAEGMRGGIAGVVGLDLGDEAADAIDEQLGAEQFAGDEGDFAVEEIDQGHGGKMGKLPMPRRR